MNELVLPVRFSCHASALSFPKHDLAARVVDLQAALLGAAEMNERALPFCASFHASSLSFPFHGRRCRRDHVSKKRTCNDGLVARRVRMHAVGRVVGRVGLREV